MTEVTVPTGGALAAPTPTRVTSTSVGDFPVPTEREEAWRFTPLSRFAGLLEESLNGGGAKFAVDGTALRADEPVQPEAGLTLQLSAVVGLSPLAGAPFDRAGAVGWSNISQTLDVAVTGAVSRPVWIDVTAEGPDTVGHVRIHAEKATQATIVLRHRGGGSLNETLEVKAEPDAKLNVVSLQAWDDTAVHMATQQMTLGQNASVKHANVTLGGDSVRIAMGVNLPSERSDLNLLGLYFTNAGKHQEHRLFIEHTGQKSKSRVTYKGALQGQEARAVWVGDVGIGPQAFGTDSYELNRNLVLGKGPRVDSVPNLEIHNGEIEGAGHASATGRFDDEQLFYLQSRGIDAVNAKRLVVRAFYAELLNMLEIPELTDYVLETVDSHLSVGSLQ